MSRESDRPASFLDHLHLVLASLGSCPPVLFQQLDRDLLIERSHPLIVGRQSARVARKKEIFSVRPRAALELQVPAVPKESWWWCAGGIRPSCSWRASPRRSIRRVRMAMLRIAVAPRLSWMLSKPSRVQ